MTSLLGTLTIDAVCVIAATLRHAVHATSFAVVYLCVVGLAALLLARIFIFRWPGAVKAAALAVAVAAYAPFAHPLEPFDMAPYDEFPVQKASQIPGMDVISGKEVLERRLRWAQRNMLNCPFRRRRSPVLRFVVRAPFRVAAKTPPPWSNLN